MGWALQQQLRWADVAPRQDETSIALVRKDPERERGKRLCVPGQLIEISVQCTEIGAYANGLLLSEAGNIVHFLAARDTGDLVSESPARFCGVVTAPSITGTAPGFPAQLHAIFSSPRENRNQVERVGGACLGSGVGTIDAPALGWV